MDAAKAKLRTGALVTWKDLRDVAVYSPAPSEGTDAPAADRAPAPPTLSGETALVAASFLRVRLP